MSDHAVALLVLPLLLGTLAALWVLMRISRHSRFSFKVSGLGVKVELTGGTNRTTKNNVNTEYGHESAN